MNKILLIIFLIISYSCISKSQELYHVFFANNQVGYASGFHISHIYKTTNAGETWIPQPPQLGQGEIGDLYFWSPDSGVALFSEVAKTTDGGLSWQFYPTGNPYWLFAVDFIDSRLGIAVGVNGKIVKTTNGGEEWNLLQSNTQIPLLDVDYLNSNLIVICGGDFNGGSGLVLRSTNGGLDWASQPLPDTTRLASISFVNNNVGIAAVAGGGKIIRTTDGGVSWSEVSSPAYYLSTCYFVSSSIAFAAGGYGNIIKTTNGGESWFSLNSPTTNSLYDIHMFNELEGIIVGNNTILKTTDGGANWILKGVIPNIPLLDLPQNGSINQFTNNLRFYWYMSTGAASYRIQVATDSLFTSLIIDSTLTITDVYFNELQNSTKYYWRVQAISSSGSSAFSEIWSFTTEPSTGVDDFDKEIPHTYILNQNNPNPFNPSTKIIFGIPKAGLVSLKVHDILGREIETLVNEEKRPGRYEVEFNGSSLASGIYFYRITTTGFTETKKMILMK
jgi:photosystem II stability/assembly factor-like uncharacterized protein